MSHVAPHRWADAAAGRLSDRQVAALDEHAATCARCRAERGRVARARDAFAELREAEPPELHWDHVGARIYWSTSSAQRAAERARRPRRWLWGVALAAPALVAAGVALYLGAERPSPDAAAIPAADEGPGDDGAADPAPPPSPEAAPLAGVVTFAGGGVTVDGGPLDFDAAVGPGARLETREGRVVVQLGPGSGFVVEPNSAVVLAAFDERRVELEVEGTVAVELAPRRADQTFRVVAGGHTVSVRGTAFRVDHRDGRVDVACSHGRVLVSDGDGEIGVGAGQRLRIRPEDVFAALSTTPAGDMAAIAVPMLPAWTEPDTLFATSATLDVEAPVGRSIFVDGVPVGEGTFSLRVMSGRHHVRADGASEGDWVDIRTDAAQRRPTRVRVSTRDGRARPGRKAAARLRRAQLEKAASRDGRIEGCLRPLRKQRLAAGTYIVLDIGVGRDGGIRHLNIADTSLPDDAARCVRNVVDQVRFPPGPAATVRARLTF